MTPLDILMFGRAGPRSSADPDALAWAAAVTGAGGTYSAATLAALSNFFVAAKANGYNSKLYCFNPMCGDQLAACLVQRVNGVWAQATNMNFVSGDYTEATGLTGNGSSKYLRTGLIPSAVLTANDTHLGTYNRSSSSKGAVVGSNNSSGQTLAMFGPFESTSTAFSDQYNVTAGAGRVNVNISAPYGHVIASRTSSTSNVIYRNGSSVTSSANSGGSLPTTELYVMARNDNGSPGAGTYSSGAIAAYHIGPSFSSTDASNCYTDLQAFQTALSRQV